MDDLTYCPKCWEPELRLREDGWSICMECMYVEPPVATIMQRNGSERLL